MKIIAVLLTVYNRKTQTLECLTNLFNQKLPSGFSFEVFLVDDGSTDGTSEAVGNLFNQVNIIKGNGNLFWNRGMHLAWVTSLKEKKYDYYLWLNDDTVLLPNALTLLLQTSVYKKNEAIVIGSTCALDNNHVITYGGRKKNGTLVLPKNEVLECEYFNGNIVLIPDFIYQKIGTNDPIFHHSLGDFDYGLRANKLGVKMFLAPGFLGKCDVHESLPVWCNPKVSFKKRWVAFRTPLGNNPENFFIYENRHNGLKMACFHYFTNHLRVLFPSLWSK